jgi:hemerythrin
MRQYYTYPLKQLKVLLRNNRIKTDYQPPSLSGPDEFDEFVSEINHLYDAIKLAQTDITDLNRIMETRITKHTEKFQKDIRVLRHKSNTDTLTGLANRGHLNQRIVEMFSEAIDHDLDLACVMIDIDYFKAINDTLGHDAGDQVIHFLSKLLQAAIRHVDFVGRFGGDEFILLFHNCSKDNAVDIAERIRLHFGRESHRFIVPEQSQPEKTSHTHKKSGLQPPQLSIGIATVKHGDPVNAEHLLKMADEALYQAKKSGRNRVKTY